MHLLFRETVWYPISGFKMPSLHIGNGDGALVTKKYRDTVKDSNLHSVIN